MPTIGEIGAKVGMDNRAASAVPIIDGRFSLSRESGAGGNGRIDRSPGNLGNVYGNAAVMTVVTHLLEGRDGLPALWHSRDERGRGGRVVVLPRLLDELTHGNQARHLAARSRSPSVVPSPAVHPTLHRSAQLQARGCPLGGSLLATAIATPPRSSSPSPSSSAAVAVVAGDRARFYTPRTPFTSLISHHEFHPDHVFPPLSAVRCLAVTRTVRTSPRHEE